MYLIKLPRKQVLKTNGDKLETINDLRSLIKSMTLMEKSLNQISKKVNRIKDIQTLGKIQIHISNHKKQLNELLKEVKTEK